MKNIIYLSLFLLVLSSCKSKSNTVNSKKIVYRNWSPKKNTPKTKKYVSNKVLKNKPKRTVKKSNTLSKKSTITISDKVINNAFSFEGTKYRYGGTTSKGMDCSGLIYTSFNLANISLPRTSSEQSKKGTRVAITKVKKGDLLFFKTGKQNKISHVGLVVNANPKNIEFIHTSSSKGVVVSSLNETYWSKAFSIAKRVF